MEEKIICANHTPAEEAELDAAQMPSRARESDRLQGGGSSLTLSD